MTIAIMPNLKLIIVYFFLVNIGSAYENEYTNEYAVHVRGGPEAADNLAVMYGYRNIGQIGSLKDHYLFEHSDLPQIAKRPATGPHTRLNDEENVQWMEQQRVIKREKRDMMNSFTDPLWSDEWYINRDGVTMKVQEAWDAGYTGKNVVVTIADDGLEIDHPDLVGNYDQEASTDLNDRDSNPYPRSTPDEVNNHGTRCAGAVAMMANNSICGVGIAYNSRIGGIRILDGRVTDALEASALSFRSQYVDVYSSSWGPNDDGKTVEGPGRLATLALHDSATKGRGGKGSIYVLAAGNGGVVDDCNCDGYQANIYTVSITSATEKGTKPFYTESCASALATTYSSGDAGERQICSTDEHQKCTKHHTGTSASAPLAAGIIALALEANPDLTWRDVQHIIVRTSKRYNLQDNDIGWTTNAAGYEVSHLYGFGLMDAEHMVRIAKKWITSPDQRICEYQNNRTWVIPGANKIILSQQVDGCVSGDQFSVNYLEHVQIVVSTKLSKRGDLSLVLISPSSTRSVIVSTRELDTSKSGLDKWPFMTTHFWGEKSQGMWSLEIENKGNVSGNLLGWDLVLYGTETQVNSEPVRLGNYSDLYGEYILNNVSSLHYNSVNRISEID